jgi:eukaryotic-like serine/threonine-protein kinase
VLSVAVTPRGASSATDCSNGCTVHEGDSAVITASKGPVPDVAGMSITDATTALTGVGLQVSSTPAQEFSDSIASGTVIGIGKRAGGGNWAPGDTVTLVVSKGPQLFPVPDVTGKTLADAKRILTAAGFVPAYALYWDAVPTIAKVTSQGPDSTTTQPKGTKINLVLSLTG